MQNQQFISEEERAAYAKIEAPMLEYRRLDMMDNDRGSAPNPVMPNGGAAVSPPNPAMPSGGAGAAAPGRCSGKARP